MTMGTTRISACLLAFISGCALSAGENEPDEATTQTAGELSVDALQADLVIAKRGWRAANGGLADTSVHALAVDALSESLAYAAASDGLYTTTNAGASWTRVPTVPGDTSLQVVTDPNLPGVAFAGGVFGDGHLYETLDAGSSWTANGALDARDRGPGQSPYARPIAIATQDSNVVYAAVDGARELFLARTIDGGQTWNVTPAPGGRGACCVTLLAQSANHAYLSTLSNPPNLWETVDGGATWTRLAGLDLAFVETLAADPRDPQVLYAAGVFSSDAGPSVGALRKSTDGGATWFAPSSQLARYSVGAFAVSNVDGRVYVNVRESPDASKSKLLVSVDGGLTFKRANRGLQGQSVSAIVPMSRLGCGAYAVTVEGDVFTTYDSGGACR